MTQDDSNGSAFWPTAGVKALKFAAALVGSAAVLWIIGLFAFVNSLTQEPELTPAADGIVVLTGGDTRINEAMNLLALKKGQRLLISGVNASIPDADVRNLVPNSDGLFDCCIDLDRSATDTIGNAHEAARWAAEHGYSSLIVVTANYHMPRSLLEFSQAMPAVELIAYPIQSGSVPVDGWWRRQSTTKFLASEYNKFMLAWLRTRMSSVLR